jgi:hypothetical protein
VCVCVCLCGYVCDGTVAIDVLTWGGAVWADVREAAMESVARAEDHGRRIDGLTVAQV